MVCRRVLHEDGGSFSIGLICHMVTLLDLGVVEAAALLSQSNPRVFLY